MSEEKEGLWLGFGREMVINCIKLNLYVVVQQTEFGLLFEERKIGTIN